MPVSVPAVVFDIMTSVHVSNDVRKERGGHGLVPPRKGRAWRTTSACSSVTSSTPPAATPTWSSSAAAAGP